MQVSLFFFPAERSICILVILITTTCQVNFFVLLAMVCLFWSGAAAISRDCFDCYEERRCPMKNQMLQIYDTKCISDCMEKCNGKRSARPPSKTILQRL